METKNNDNKQNKSENKNWLTDIKGRMLTNKEIRIRAGKSYSPKNFIVD